ncbi:hypothetical protein OJF2_11220 [Aquisphaera giovannonii]|uniref:Cytochrome c domain-containing protein n=1 Tax=Aquisphaera giovannonii TaxID=406548 RepID=A0A5B9VW94_9BACT|nr:DUF1592 domain-containing protein [Aquisphaera giovannonii]QEH32643.1 hypothetical protein OJF2_11220 [Aquisphaera giovannonii]
MPADPCPRRIASALLLLALLPAASRGDDKAGAGPKPAAKPDAAAFESAVRPFLAKHCAGCHGEKKPKGNVSVAALMKEPQAGASRKLWSKVKESVEGTLMPPEDRPQPSKHEVEALVGWIESALNQTDCGRTVDPGRVTIRRLNRAEYDNTIRDLVGVDFRPADDFPSDDVGYGFDNIGDVLSVPPLLMEKYLAAAEDIAGRAIVVGGRPSKPPLKTWEAEALEGPGVSGDGDAQVLASDGEVGVSHAFPQDDAYVIRVRAYGQQAGPEPARMAIRVDGKPLKVVDVPAVQGSPGTYEVREKIRAGNRRVSAAFLNDYYKPDDPDPSRRDRNLAVLSIEVEGPLRAPGSRLPESHRRIVFKTPKKPSEFQDCAVEVVQRFASRAYRRPVTGGELAKLLRFVDLARENGDPFERGIQLAVEATLVSPQFLYRAELNRGRRKGAKDASGVPLNDFEVASRLSYFLWSSMPDEELTRLAVEGKLLAEDNLVKQVRRMLRDRKAGALVENFAGQWLQLRNLKAASPDREQFPSFDEPLRQAMGQESEAFFAAVMREDKSILDFLDCDYTYLNERLAKHYGIGGVSGEKFRMVRLKGRERGGLITQAAVLTVTSNPSRTSPVKRGKWVLEQILGTPPPPAPPNVPQLADDRKEPLKGTLRQRMEQHRSNPSCAACHSRLDPPGFGLENFDAVGAWRDKEAGMPIDASAKLPGGESFRGPAELKAILRSKKDQFTRCLAEKMLTYALGRGLEDFDGCTVDRIVQAVADGRYKFSSLVIAIVKSDPFLKRRG